MADEAASRELDRTKKLRAEEDDKSKLDVTEMFDLLMMVWEETFERVNYFVNTTAEATEIALEKARQNQITAAEALKTIQNQATVLPDGRRVYRDKDGNAYTEDGAQIPATDAARIKWAEGSPSWESYQAANEANEQARLSVEEIERFQQRLQATQALLSKAKPESLSQEELERLESDLDRDTPAAVRKERDRLMSERPEPEARAVRDARADDDLSVSSVNLTPTAAPRVAMPSLSTHP
ncbi:hypothetical protein M2352_003696 [Azospirillum fermentarium]|uniref:hypothetical protein n=1 Tax=Azospirillum fermentarium TaxID=1233114 RepID=UPI00222658B8|nr:hypothetical protein [Azospirillum fermentarium]MCW2248062.1 hypothetical protein [Azospirillum fermentarium]